MHNDLNIIGRYAEKVHCLNKFKALIHHRCRIDGYLCAHAPVRMLYSLLGRYILKLRAAFASERAAAAGEQYLFQLSGRSSH